MTVPEQKFTLPYPPALHPNIDIPYDMPRTNVPQPFFGELPEHMQTLLDLKDVDVDVNVPGVGRATAKVSPSGYLGSQNPEPTVVWESGCLSWHERNGNYRTLRENAPNFIAASGAKMWLAPDGTFENRGPKAINYINSAGFSFILNPTGTALKNSLAIDVNGIGLAVDDDFMITRVVNDVRPPHIKADPKYVLPYYLRGPVQNAAGKFPALFTTIAGSLAHPVFGGKSTEPNLMTRIEGIDIVFHYVTGFPYVRADAWTYAEHGEQGIGRFGYRHGEKLRPEVAVQGKIAGHLPRKAMWSETCGSSKYGIMQVGGTCASTACLNILLCCTPLRNYCVKVINGFMGTQDLKGLAMMAKWDSSRVVASESLTETILHAIYKRLCGTTLTTPDTLTVSAVCLKEQTFTSKLYCSTALNTSITNFVVLLDIFRALGLTKGVMHPYPQLIIPPKKFDYALIHKHTLRAETVPENWYNFPLAGAFISLQYENVKKPKTDGKPNYGGHAVAGIVCDDGKRAVFDSNFGELDIDWVKHPEGIEAHFLKNYGPIHQYGILVMYLSNEFRTKHATEVPCMSTTKAHMITLPPIERSKEILCALGSSLERGSIRTDPVNIADGEVVNIRYWKSVPERVAGAELLDLINYK